MTKKSNQEDDFSVIRFILDVFVDVALVVVLVIVFRQFLFAPFQVSGRPCVTLSICMAMSVRMAMVSM